MQILLTGDLHYALRQYDWLVDTASAFDAVALAGDMLDLASDVPREAQALVVRAYLAALARHAPVLACSGNHDLTASTKNGERNAAWLADPPEKVVTDGGATCLGDTLFSVVPWWDGPATRTAVADQLARDAADRPARWIWLYHAPPADTPVSWSGVRHFGDPVLRDWIADFGPDFVLCGHVHEAPFARGGSWAHRLGGCWVFNMGQQPGDRPAHIVLDLEASEACWYSIYGAERLTLSHPDARPEPISPERTSVSRAAGPRTAPGA